jgi:hypothetical protein
MSSLRIGSDMLRGQPGDLRIDLKSGRYSYTLNGKMIEGQGGLKPEMLERWLLDTGTFTPEQYSRIASEQMCQFISETNTERAWNTGRQYANPSNMQDTSSSLVPAPYGMSQRWFPPAFMTAASSLIFIDEAPSPRKQTSIVAIWIGLWLLSGWAVYLRVNRAITPAPAFAASPAGTTSQSSTPSLTASPSGPTASQQGSV